VPRGAVHQHDLNKVQRLQALLDQPKHKVESKPHVPSLLKVLTIPNPSLRELMRDVFGAGNVLKIEVELRWDQFEN